MNLKLKTQQKEHKMFDQLIIESQTSTNQIKLKPIRLINDKQIYFIRVKEEDYVNQKSYLLGLMVMVGNELITTNYADTKLLLSEIKLFDRGNKQNTFTSLEKFDNDINLKLNLHKSHIYISKAEALTITSMFDESKQGVSMQRIIENEFVMTPSVLTKLLDNTGLLGRLVK